MTEVHVCDLVIGKAGSEITRQSLIKAERKFGDLFACLTDLYVLRLGEPVWCLLLKDKAHQLRVSLAPRRQLLLDLTIGGQRNVATLDEEAQLIFSQIQHAQIKVTCEARQLVARAEGEPFPADDPVSKMLLRKSGKQWSFSRSNAMAQLAFPEIESVTVDKEPVRIQGVVELATSRRIELVNVLAPKTIGEVLTKLTVDRCGCGGKTWNELACVEATIDVSVFLHRCLFTRHVIGASLANIPPTSPQQARLDQPPGA